MKSMAFTFMIATFVALFMSPSHLFAQIRAYGLFGTTQETEIAPQESIPFDEELFSPSHMSLTKDGAILVELPGKYTIQGRVLV